MPWLLLEEKVLSSIEVGSDRSFVGQSLHDGGGSEETQLIMSTKLIHTFRRTKSMDFIFLDENFKILEIKTLIPSRIKFSPLGTKSIVKTNEGDAARWNVQVNDILEIRS
tara:strand:+ start:47 stop:376 length:330 start_codon:yes stop_codon:yes gene_type:complete